MKQENILLFCAHSDDQMLGAGGVLAKYAKEGHNVYTYIFTYGELSHMHMKPEEIKKIRAQESENADKIIGGKGVFFFDLEDGNLQKDIKKSDIKEYLKEIIKEKKPSKIFTHSIDDAHPDHRAVRKVVLEAYDELLYTCDVYSFDVWNLVNIKKRQKPVLVVDVTDYFKYKIKALHEFKSQISIFNHFFFVNILYLLVYVKAIIYGFIYKKKLVEIYHKMR